MPTVTKATSRKRGIAKVTKAAQKTPLPGDQVTEQVPSEGPIKRGTPAHLKVPQFDPKASAKQDADENREKFSKLCREIGARLVEERKRFTRPKLAKLVGLTPSELWRCEQGRARAHEVEKIQVVLAQIDSGELTPPERPKPFGGKTGGASKAKLKEACERARHALSEVPVSGKVTTAQFRAAIGTALDALDQALKN